MTTFPLPPNDLDFSEYTLLVVDDTPTNLRMMSSYLEHYQFEVLVAKNGKSALERAKYAKPDLILLDIMMPEWDGFETCTQLKANPETAQIPVIFMTALADMESKLKGFAVGAVDYITKPVQYEEALARITTHLRIQNLTRSLQQKNRQMELSSKVGRQITSVLDPKELMYKLLKEVQHLFGYTHMSIWSINDRKKVLQLQARVGYDTGILPGSPPTLALEHRQSIISRVVQTGEPYCSNNVSADDYFMPTPGFETQRAELAIPLRFNNKILGVFDIQSSAENAFQDDDIVAFQSLADQVSIAIRNAALYNRLSSLNNELEQKVAERTAELQLANHNLEQLDKAKTDFIHVISHELRTPLTLVHGFAQLLELDENIRAHNQEMLENLFEGIDRMKDIIDIILDVTRFDTGTVVIRADSLNLTALLTDLQDEFAPAVEARDLTLTLHNVTALPVIQGDRELIYKALYHVIINAIKYTPNGGEININCRVKTVSAQKGIVELVVQDTGIGIEADHLALIFEKFYQTGLAAFHSSGKTSFRGGGPGLGLTIARNAIQAHNGQIWAESPGFSELTYPGSKFFINLPLDV